MRNQGAKALIIKLQHGMSGAGVWMTVRTQGMEMERLTEMGETWWLVPSLNDGVSIGSKSVYVVYILIH